MSKSTLKFSVLTSSQSVGAFSQAGFSFTRPANFVAWFLMSAESSDNSQVTINAIGLNPNNYVRITNNSNVAQTMTVKLGVFTNN